MRFELFGIRVEIGRLSTIAARRQAVAAKKQEKPTESASRDFWGAFAGGGSLVVTCACGRTHFPANTSLDYDEGELESLLKRAAAERDKYVVDYRNDSIGVLDVGNILAWNCPCRNDARYERFIWEYRDQIVDYYRVRAERMKERCERFETALEAVSR
jgi:hypothetical protein